MAWYLSGHALDGWNFAFLGLLPWLGEHIAALRLGDMELSLFNLLPRLVPGPQLFLDAPSLYDTPVYRLPKSSSPVPNALVASDDGLKFHFAHRLGPEMESEVSLARYSLTIWEIQSAPVHLLSFPRRNWKARRSGKYAQSRNPWHAVSSLTVGDKLSLACFLATISLIVVAVWRKDGAAVIGITILSFSATIANFYHVRLFERMLNSEFLRRTWRTVVVRTDTDAIWIIKCDLLAFGSLLTNHVDKEAAGGVIDPELSWAISRPGRIPTRDRLSRLLSSVGDIVPWLAYWLFANSEFVTQLAIACSYIMITFLYYAVPLKSPNPVRFSFTRQYVPGTVDAHLAKPDLRPSEVSPTLARTLWYAIRITKTTAWFHHIIGPQSPETQARWDQWLTEAAENAENGDWPAEGEKRRIVDLKDDVYQHAVEEPKEQDRDPGPEIGSVPVSKW